MSLIGAMYPATAPPPVDAAPTTTAWSTPGRTESGLARGLGHPDRAVLEPPRDPSAQLDRVVGGIGVRAAALSRVGKARRGRGLHARPAGARRAVARLRLTLAGLADREPGAGVGPPPGLRPGAARAAGALSPAGAPRELHRAHDVRSGAGPDARARVPRRAARARRPDRGR